MSAPPTPPANGGPARLGLLGRISGRSVVAALLLALLVASVLNPIFAPPFPVLLGRTLFIAMVLLLAYTVGAQWPRERIPGWLPRWMVPVLAVAVAAPLATFAAYAMWLGGDVRQLLANQAITRGFTWLAGAGLVIGLLVTLGALVREREAQATAQALQFELDRSRLEKLASDARLQLLTAQIEPHFLFNTLANVQALVESGSPRAPELMKHLIAYLRAAIPQLHQGEPTLGREVALVRAYLELMRMRMPDRLQFAVELPLALEARRFPPMALLTLVENAVRHGIDPLEDGGRIELRAGLDADGSLRVCVTDTGRGLRLDKAAAPAGTGLANLRERLAAFFDGRARLELSENAPHGLVAEITIAA
jgi:signal transduction histidine kinase